MIRLTALTLMASLMLSPKAEIEVISAGVFHVDAYNSQEGIINKTQRKPHQVMFNMAHILFAEEVSKSETSITIEYGNDVREFIIKMKYNDVMKGIKSTYQRGQ